jgi:hypothetical protein
MGYTNVYTQVVEFVKVRPELRIMQNRRTHGGATYDDRERRFSSINI